MMAFASATISFPSTSIATFHTHLQSSKRILALLGAGLSASSGLGTYRGVGASGLWREKYPPSELSNIKAFQESPELVWEYHQERREKGLEAQPNAAHSALAKLAEVKGRDKFLALSMNVDGLSRRAGHAAGQLGDLHGSLFDLRCTKCEYYESDNLDPELIKRTVKDTTGTTEETTDTIIIPKCPQCDQGMLRPAIVWFGEPLPKTVCIAADEFIKAGPIDLVLVIGTTAQVWPAAGYVDDAIDQGASVAMVNLDRGDLVPEGGALGLTHRDWFFVGDSAELVPKLLEPLIGLTT